jgi:hypothetical protein
MRFAENGTADQMNAIVIHLYKYEDALVLDDSHVELAAEPLQIS